MSERVKGLVSIAIGLAIGAVLFGVLIVLSKAGIIEPTIRTEHIGGVAVEKSSYSAIWGIPAVPPLFTTVFGLIQLVTGKPMAELARSYDTMSGGKRFVVSVLVVALAVAVIGCLVAIAFAFML